MLKINAADEAELLDERQLADWLRISVRTVQAWRVSGNGPSFVRIGRRVRYTRADVLNFLSRRTVASTSAAVAA